MSSTPHTRHSPLAISFPLPSVYCLVVSVSACEFNRGRVGLVLYCELESVATTLIPSQANVNSVWNCCCELCHSEMDTINCSPKVSRVIMPRLPTNDLDRCFSSSLLYRYSMVWAMGSLGAAHYYRLVTDYGGWHLDFTLPLMIIVQKITYVACALHDGECFWCLVNIVCTNPLPHRKVP